MFIKDSDTGHIASKQKQLGNGLTQTRVFMRKMPMGRVNMSNNYFDDPNVEPIPPQQSPNTYSTRVIAQMPPNNPSTMWLPPSSSIQMCYSPISPTTSFTYPATRPPCVTWNQQTPPPSATVWPPPQHQPLLFQNQTPSHTDSFRVNGCYHSAALNNVPSVCSMESLDDIPIEQLYIPTDASFDINDYL